MLARETTQSATQSTAPNMYNVEGSNRLSPGRQHLTTGSVLEIHFFQSDSVNVLSILEIILLSSSYKHLRVVSV